MVEAERWVDPAARPLPISLPLTSSTMPRILRIINRFNLGGPTHNAAYLSRYMPAGFETLLIGGPPGENEEGSGHILDSLGVEARILDEMRREVSPWKDRRAYRSIKRIIKEFKPDIVHTHAAKAGAVGRLAASDLGVPSSTAPPHASQRISPWPSSARCGLPVAGVNECGIGWDAWAFGSSTRRLAIYPEVS